MSTVITKSELHLIKLSVVLDPLEYVTASPIAPVETETLICGEELFNLLKRVLEL